MQGMNKIKKKKVKEVKDRYKKIGSNQKRSN